MSLKEVYENVKSSYHILSNSVILWEYIDIQNLFFHSCKIFILINRSQMNFQSVFGFFYLRITMLFKNVLIYCVIFNKVCDYIFVFILLIFKLIVKLNFMVFIILSFIMLPLFFYCTKYTIKINTIE